MYIPLCPNGWRSHWWRNQCTEWIFPLDSRLGTDHSQASISNTKRSFINHGKKTWWLNLNQAETAANNFVDVILRGKRGRSVLEWTRMGWKVRIWHVSQDNKIGDFWLLDHDVLINWTLVISFRNESGIRIGQIGKLISVTSFKNVEVHKMGARGRNLMV